MAEKILTMIAHYKQFNGSGSVESTTLVKVDNGDTSGASDVELRDEPMTFALITMVCLVIYYIA